MEQTDNNIILKSTVNYPNNEELSYQKLYFDKSMNLNKVEVFDEDNVVKIKVNFNEVNLKAKLDKDDFVLEDLIDENISNNNCQTEEDCENNCSTESCKTSKVLDDIIYPLYIPANTYLSDSETISGEDTNRIILTFSGDRNFVIVEEVSKVNNEFEVIPVYGDPLMLNEAIGALSNNSLSWDANNVNYYLVSSDLTPNEMVMVAASLGNSTLVSSLK